MMSAALCSLLLAAISVWDMPFRQIRHDYLRRQLVESVKAGDSARMAEVCRQGVKFLPEEPTWRYNLACALAKGGQADAALEELAAAIKFGFPHVEAIATDPDFASLSASDRFQELLEAARSTAPQLDPDSPFASVPAEGAAGGRIALSARNVVWDLETGCFRANLRLTDIGTGGNCGDLYVNRDRGHSAVSPAAFPGLTVVGLDKEGLRRGLDLDLPNMLYPLPVFGNASRAFGSGKSMRSLPRTMMTTDSRHLKAYVRFYLSNQVWVFPANTDCPPIGRNGDVFPSIAPYWLVTAGRSWSDLPYLKGALEASRSLPPETKAEVVRRGLLAPTVMTLIRKSLAGVADETDYLGPKAHPAALPPGGLDLARLKSSAAALTPSAVPPLVPVSVAAVAPTDRPRFPEPTYSTAFASAFVLRAADTNRVFVLQARQAEEFAFSVVHDDLGAARLERLRPDLCRLTLDRTRLTISNRVDVAVFGRNAGTGWGAPSYVSFAVTDTNSDKSDPYLQ